MAEEKKQVHGPKDLIDSCTPNTFRDHSSQALRQNWAAAIARRSYRVILTSLNWMIGSMSVQFFMSA